MQTDTYCLNITSSDQYDEKWNGWLLSYLDGSKHFSGVGVAIYDPQNKYKESLRLAANASILTAEIYEYIWL